MSRNRRLHQFKSNKDKIKQFVWWTTSRKYHLHSPRCHLETICEGFFLFIFSLVLVVCYSDKLSIITFVLFCRFHLISLLFSPKKNDNHGDDKQHTSSSLFATFAQYSQCEDCDCAAVDVAEAVAVKVLPKMCRHIEYHSTFFRCVHHSSTSLTWVWLVMCSNAQRWKPFSSKIIVFTLFSTSAIVTCLKSFAFVSHLLTARHHRYRAPPPSPMPPPPLPPYLV